jgi:TRAP-type mannitol/chloroaromatic compound transport system substrate-binding protein
MLFIDARLACFAAASEGIIEAFMGTPSYWADREPAIEWFQTVPFGMNPEGRAAWCYQGEGLKLWEKTHATFNLVPRQGPAFAPQMAGWFRKKINAVGDYKRPQDAHSESGRQGRRQGERHDGAYPR